MKYLLIIASVCALLSCHKTTMQDTTWTTTETGLQYKILKEGEGPKAQNGQDVQIHESTKYRDGTLIFSSEGMKPLQFTLGSKMVIQGVEEGVIGMKKGEVRKLIVPTSLSKRRSYPPILSKDSILVYEIHLIDIIQ